MTTSSLDTLSIFTPTTNAIADVGLAVAQMESAITTVPREDYVRTLLSAETVKPDTWYAIDSPTNGWIVYVDHTLQGWGTLKTTPSEFYKLSKQIFNVFLVYELPEGLLPSIEPVDAISTTSN